MSSNSHVNKTNNYGHDTVSPQSFGSEHILIVRRGEGAFLSGRDTEGSVEIRHSMCGGRSKARTTTARRPSPTQAPEGDRRPVCPLDAFSISDNTSVAGVRLIKAQYLLEIHDR